MIINQPLINHLLMQELNTDNFHATVKANKAVLVDFYANWCAPCRMLTPTLEAIGQRYASKLKVFKVDTDEHPKIASEYGVRNIPTLLLFIDGEKKDMMIGAVPESSLATFLDKYLPTNE